MDRNFFLIGGIHDPLSLRYEVVLRDADGIEHKSAERYYWYKMAELFKDTVFNFYLIDFHLRTVSKNYGYAIFAGLELSKGAEHCHIANII